MTEAVQFVHDERFVEPFLNRPHTVLGERLLPFSLWTQFNLELIQSPFLLGHREPTLHDLWAAVRCASTPWTPAHYGPDLAVPRRLFARLAWSLRYQRYDLRMETAKFAVYMRDFATGPRFWSNHHKGTCDRAGSDLDDNLELAGMIEHGFKLPPETVWTMPLGQLRWRAAILNRIKGGDLRVWTPLDEQRAEAHRKEQEAAIKARADELVRTRPRMTPETAERLARDELRAKAAANLNRLTNQGPVPPPAEPL